MIETTLNYTADRKTLLMKDLVLLVGFSRSGTSWLSKILDSRPTVYLRSEPDKRINSHVRLGHVPHCIDPHNISWIQKYRDGLMELLERMDCNFSSFPFFKKSFIATPYSVYWTIACAWQFCNYVANQWFRRSLALPSHLVKRSTTSVDVVWKSVNQSSNLEFVRKAFPGIKIIYVLRNPYAVLTSTLQHNKMAIDGNDYRRILERKSAPFFKENPIDLEEVKLWPEIKKKALLWRIDCESALISGAESKDFYLLLYEDLVKNPVRMINKLFRWLGWDITQEIESFLLQSTGYKKPPYFARIFSSGYFGVYHKPGGNVVGWKKKITNSDYNIISSVVLQSPLLTYWPHELVTK